MKTVIQSSFGIGLLLAAQSSQLPSDFCQSSRTTAALHSANCPNAFVEKDAGKVDGIQIEHSPPYHTYSRWDLNGHSYIVAYWDQDNDPVNVQADIHLSRRQLDGTFKYDRLLTIPAFETVERVSTQEFTGDGSKQLVVVSLEGQLEVARIVRFASDGARLVFNRSGTRIQFTDKVPAEILVYANAANETELFRWSKKRQGFIRAASSPGFVGEKLDNGRRD